MHYILNAILIENFFILLNNNSTSDGRSMFTFWKIHILTQYKFEVVIVNLG